MTPQPYRHSTKKRLGLWGVVFAFLLQMLAWSAMPVAVAGSDSDDDWVVICTSDGFKRISLSEAGFKQDDSQHNPNVLVDHCDLCVFAHGLGMAPAPVQLFKHASAALILRSRSVDIVSSDKLHTPQQPRAPPAHKHI